MVAAQYDGNTYLLVTAGAKTATVWDPVKKWPKLFCHLIIVTAVNPIDLSLTCL